jgi:hypothetical protein
MSIGIALADLGAIRALTLFWSALYCVVDLEANPDAFGRECAVYRYMPEELASRNCEFAVVPAMCLPAKIPVIVT